MKCWKNSIFQQNILNLCKCIYSNKSMTFKDAENKRTRSNGKQFKKNRVHAENCIGRKSFVVEYFPSQVYKIFQLDRLQNTLNSPFLFKKECVLITAMTPPNILVKLNSIDFFSGFATNVKTPVQNTSLILTHNYMFPVENWR